MGTLADTLWQEFAVETEEHLQAVEPILAQPDPTEVAAADIAQLFRSFHSIKGLARAMDVLGMESVAHHAENLLGLVRDGRTQLTLELADLLLQAVDALKGMRDGVAARRQDSPPEPELIARLAAAFEKAGGAIEPAPHPAAAAPAVAARDTPLHENPEMLGVFVEIVQTLGPELCRALEVDAGQRAAALDAAESLAHAADVMNFDALSAGFGGLRDTLRKLPSAGELDEPVRTEIVARLGDIRLQVELLGELTDRDAGTLAFSAMLAQRIGDERRRLALALVSLVRRFRESVEEGDRLAAEADAGAASRAAGRLRALVAALSHRRSAGIVLLVEDLYARIAGGEVEPSEAVVNTLGAIVSQLAADPGDGGAADLGEAEAVRLAGRLRSLTASTAQRALEAGDRLVAGLHIPAELLAILSDENLAALREGIEQEGLLPYAILVHTGRDTEIAGRWTRWLKAEARPITNRTVLADGESWFEVLALSRLDPSALTEALRAIDPAARCIKRVRRLTDSEVGELVFDRSTPQVQFGTTGDAGPPAAVPPLAPPAAQSTIRVRSDLVDALLDDVGEFRAVAATLRHLIRGIGSRAIMSRARAFAGRLTPELRDEFLVLVRDARERDRGLLETEEVIGGMLSRLHQGALELRVVPVDIVFNRLPRLVRDLAQHQGKSVELVLEGRDVRIDKSMVDALADPLIHMVRNAVDHGVEMPAERRAAGKPERARLTLHAVERGTQIHIEVGDDGRGLDAAAIRARAVARGLLSVGDAASLPDEQIFRFVFEAGLSTAASVTETSGRGVGMDVVLTTVRRLDGDVDVRSAPGSGTIFTLRLPVSAALQTALIVRVGDQSLAIPERHIVAVAEIDSEAIRLVGNRRSILHRQAVLPLYGLADLLGMPARGPVTGAAAERSLEPIVVASNGRQMIGLEVDAIEQRQELFLKDLDPRLARFPGVGGASLLGDGRVVLVLDGDELIQLAARGVEPAATEAAETAL
jgi:chemotaxis protein histidine kinase CheA